MIRRAWGFGASAFSFALFGLGGVVLPLLVFPLLRALPGSREQRQIRCQLAVHRSFRAYVALIEALGVVRMRVCGAEELRAPGQLVVANHPTLLDAPDAPCKPGLLFQAPNSAGAGAGYNLIHPGRVSEERMKMITRQKGDLSLRQEVSERLD